MPSSDVKVLSVIPPMTQLNTPYPSTAYLTGFLRSQGVAAVQEDLALQLVLRLLSQAGLADVRAAIDRQGAQAVSEPVASFVAQFDAYAATIDAVIGFLQGRDPTLAHRINTRRFLPEGPRFRSLDVYVQLNTSGEESKYGLRCANVFHAGDGNLHPLILYDANAPGELERTEAFGGEILELSIRVGGTKLP